MFLLFLFLGFAIFLDFLFWNSRELCSITFTQANPPWWNPPWRGEALIQQRGFTNFFNKNSSWEQIRVASLTLVTFYDVSVWLGPTCIKYVSSLCCVIYRIVFFPVHGCTEISPLEVKYGRFRNWDEGT